MQAYQLRIIRHFEWMLQLKIGIVVICVRIEKDGAICFHPVISDCTEIWLTVVEERDVGFGIACFAISTQLFDLFTVLHKRDVFLHQVDLANDGQKRQYFDVYIPLYLHSNGFFIRKCLVAQSYTILFFVKYPPILVTIWCELNQFVVLLFYSLKLCCLFWGYWHWQLFVLFYQYFGSV